MSTLQPGITGLRPGTKKGKKEDRSGRKQKVRAKRAASAMATVEELAAVLGCGRNQAYALVTGKDGEPPKVPSLRFGRRYLIPRAIITKLINGEGVLSVTTAENTA
jgi:hypothetical protein